MSIVTEKKCNACELIKPISAFRKRHAKCRKCETAIRAKWVEKNRDKTRAIDKKYRESHPGSNYEGVKQWRIENPLKFSLQRKRYFDKHPEVKSICKQNRRVREGFATGEVTTKQWRDLLQRYNHKCLCCGRSDVKLTIDHVLPLSKGGTNTIDNIQPLCGSCNSRKHDKHIDYRPH